MSEAPEDLLVVTHPVNPLLSVHGRCRDGDAAFGDGVLAERAEGLLWRIRGGGPGEPGDAVVDYLLVDCGGRGASPRACRAEAVLPSGRYRHSGKGQGMAGGNGLL